MKKKMLYVLLAVVMCLSLAIPVFAEGDEGIEPYTERDHCPYCDDGYLEWRTERRYKEEKPVRCTHFAHGTDIVRPYSEWEIVSCSKCTYYDPTPIGGDNLLIACNGYNY